VDGSDPLPLDQIRAVHAVITEVIRENDAPAPPELIVVNKIDAADPVTLTQLRGLLPGAAFVSARTGEGIAELRTQLDEVLLRPEIEVNVRLPYSRGDLMARIHSDGQILESSHEEDGTLIHARVPQALASALLQYAGSA
jgi:GTP-binding protein HflX